MASKLSVIIEAVDNISSKFASIADSGRGVIANFRDIEDSANNAFSNMERSIEEASRALESSSSSTDYWTDAIGTYDKGAMEAIYTTEELVEMGYKTEDALTDAAKAADEAADELGNYGDKADEAGKKTDEFGEKSKEAFEGLNAAIAGAGVVILLNKVQDALEKCAEKGELLETSSAKLQTIAGQSYMANLSSEALQLSYDTGQAANLLNDVAYNAVSAGTAAEESMNTAATATELAIAGFTDSSSALSVLETAMNSYGDAAGSAEQISDSLIQVQNLGVTTVAELASQMGKSISTASAYNVSLGNLESAYISVTKAGIPTAESTTYISSMLNELGNSGSQIAKVLSEETGESFGQLMSQGMSLADVLSLVYDSCDRNAEAMMNMWGSAEAGKAANAIISQGLDTFNENLLAVQNSAGSTARAYEVMAQTTEFAHNRMDNAAQNVEATIGGQLNPTLTKLYNAGADVLENIGKFLTEYPQITSAVTALTAGIATFATGLLVYEGATKAAQLATALFNAELMANPAFWVVAGISALVGGIVLLATSMEEEIDVSNDLTATSMKQQEELENLNAEYKEAVAKYGETSEEASRLKYELDDLSASFEANKQTVAEFSAECEGLIGAHQDLVSEYESNVDAIHENELGTYALIQKLSDLANSTTQTAGTQAEMEAIIDELNASVDGLALSYSDLIINQDSAVESIRAMAHAQAEQEKYQAAYEEYVGLIKEEARLEEELAKSKDVVTDAQERVNEAHEAYTQAYEKAIKVSAGYQIKQHMKSYKEEVDSANAALEEHIAEQGALQESYDDNLAKQKEIEEQFGLVEDAANGAGGAQISEADAVTNAINGSRSTLDELANAYDEAYAAAYDSISGQYSLWDIVSEVAATSIGELNSAMDSQISYWENYAANLENLASRNVEGLSQMVANMDDGSTESAAALAAMASASDSELTNMVAKYSNLQEAQSKTASQMADMETEFSSALNQMNTDLQSSVDKMNMEDSASAAAKKTIQAYIDSIKAMVPQAQGAAQAVSNAAASALNASPSAAAIPKHADGTTDSENVYIAGEEGSELILSGGGDTVFPHSETEKIISAVSDYESDERVIADPDVGGSSHYNSTSNSYEENSGLSDRTVTIKLEGSGTIGTGQGTSAESMWDSVKGNVKSVFMQILQEEIYEEGAGAYEY